MNGLHRLIVACACLAMWSGSRDSVFAQDHPAKPPRLNHACKPNAVVFGLWELEVMFPPAMIDFEELPDTQIHDAYDRLVTMAEGQ